MDLRFTDDEIAFRDEVRAFFAQALPPEIRRKCELGRRISEAIESLTPDHRAVILLREIEGLSYEEIAEVMDCSLGTVMSRLHYARKKLQAKLKELL